MRAFLTALALALACPLLAATATPDEGEVRVPLSEYTRLAGAAATKPRTAPVPYAIGDADVAVRVVESDGRTTARVEVRVMIETFENAWTLIPILPRGVALTRAVVDGQPVQLAENADGLAWSREAAGTVTMQLSYGVDAERAGPGFVLPIPVPRAAAMRLDLLVPGVDVPLSVVPSVDWRARNEGNATRLSATVPATSSILVSWRAAIDREYAMSRARYTGRLTGEALAWRATLEVETFTDEPVTLPVLPSSATLGDILVDGQAATVIEQDGQFATVLTGRGVHAVTVLFEVPVIRANGPPQAQIKIPRVPVSRFELELPGKKEVKVSPRANVTLKEGAESTVATVLAPMSSELTFTWNDTIPESLREQVRANASLYHAVHAEEGVLHGRGFAIYEITHGETNQLKLEIPQGVQVNRIEAPGGAVTDWAVSDSADGKAQRLDVFLNRAVSGNFPLEVSYERLLGGESRERPPIAVPLLSALEVHRQRGMVALLAGQELVLEPEREARLTRVGENALPAAIRNQLTLTVAHTYKYTDAAPELVVRAVAPERKQGKFDASVDTLLSVGEVTMKAVAVAEIGVKSGALVDLELTVPANVNVLGVSGPSLRSHQVSEADDKQIIAIEFTREMEGQFRVEVSYERIIGDGEAEIDAPKLNVSGAEVEHGRIAVEALTAVEIAAAATDQLSSLDVNELPRQLVLKTTNPILLAYRYVHATPPARLTLRITRHREIEVQVAAIEQARYKTLYTRDGLAVTTAHFTVRNSRRQFLRLAMPPNTQIWSVFVDGRAEKPAYAREDGENSDGRSVLVRMINSATGFPVELVYATSAEAMAFSGAVSGRLPRPDMIVTHTTWDLFLPKGPRYDEPETDMDVVRSNARADQLTMRSAAATDSAGALRIDVPTRGIWFTLEKLYANRASTETGFKLHYVSLEASQLGTALSIVGALALWLVVVLARGARARRSTLAVLALGGGATLGVALGYLNASPVPAAGVSVLIAVLLVLWAMVQGLRRWRARRALAID